MSARAAKAAPDAPITTPQEFVEAAVAGLQDVFPPGAPLVLITIVNGSKGPRAHYDARNISRQALAKTLREVAASVQTGGVGR